MPGRVAHVLRKYDPQQWGGTETHVVEITRRLSAIGWSSEIHAPSGPGANDGARRDVPLERFDAVLPFIGATAKRKALIANAGNIVSFDELAKLVRRRDLSLVHVHTLRRLGGVVRTAMRWTGRPYIVSIHGPLLAEPDMVANDTATRLKGLWDVGAPLGAMLGARRVLDDAARVITFNDDEYRALRQRIGARAVRMDHGVDATRFAAGRKDCALARWPALSRGPVVTLVGRLSAQKNQLLALRAFAHGAPADAQLALAGAETDRGMRDRILAEALALGIATRVHVLGNLDPLREIPDLYAASDLVVIPSTHEAFGLAVLEGWAAERPVLFAAHTGMRDLATALGPDALTVPSLDEEAWRAAIAAHFADGARSAASIQPAAQLVQTRYQWDAIARKLASIYDEVIECSRVEHMAHAAR